MRVMTYRMTLVVTLPKISKYFRLQNLGNPTYDVCARTPMEKQVCSSNCATQTEMDIRQTWILEAA